MLVFLNGQFLPETEAMVPLNDRGWLLGDGIFETVRVANGRAFRLAQHLERFVRGANFLKIQPPFLPKEIQQFAAQLIADNNFFEGVLRVTLTRGVGPRGYSIKGTHSPTFAMTLHPLPNDSVVEPVQWTLATSTFRIPASDGAAGFKTTSKITNILARAEAEEKGADEALLLNTNGEVAETAGGNIFWVYNDKICTVPTGRGVLPGITRAVVLELCQVLGLPTNKCVIKPEQLRRADGIFVTQSLLGIIPVAALDGSPIAPSPLVEHLATAYHAALVAESA